MNWVGISVTRLGDFFEAFWWQIIFEKVAKMYDDFFGLGEI